MGAPVDLDLFIVHKETKTVSYFGNRTAINGVQLSADNTTGAGDGDDEFAKFDATVTGDGTYVIAANIYNGASKNQSFALVSNAKATVYNDETNEALAEFKISADGGSNTGLIIGTLKDVGNTYIFEAAGTYVNGNINEITAAL